MVTAPLFKTVLLQECLRLCTTGRRGRYLGHEIHLMHGEARFNVKPLFAAFGQ